MKTNLDRILLKLAEKEGSRDVESLRLEVLSRLEKLPTKGGGQWNSRSNYDFLEHFCAGIKTDSDCWLWQRALNSKKTQGIFTGNYGIAWHKTVKHKCHRLSKFLFHGRNQDEPNNALHTCDNPRCCNPSHIYWGTHKSNSKDCKDHGRLHREMGVQRYNAKLTEEQVAEILAEAPTRKYGWGRAKAKKFGVGYTAISNIVTGWRWKQMSGLSRPGQVLS